MQRIIILVSIAVLSVVSQHIKAQTTAGQTADSMRKQNLKAVTVTGNKPFIVMKADKVVVNVSESPIAAGGDAAQVLTNAPGVVEQSSGNFELRGKKVIVLIDGKDSRLSGEELKEWLSAMPSNTIDRIELIANPPARYDARGAAVINIISARNKSFGTSGTFTAGLGAGRYGRYNGGLGLNYRDKGINIYGNYDYQHNKQYYDLYSNRTLADNSAIVERTNDVRTRDNHSVKAGLDYDINRNSSIGVLVKGMLNYRDREVFTRSVKDDGTAAADPFSTVNTTGKARIQNPSVNIYYKTKLDTSGKLLTLNADYFRYNKTWKDDLSTNFYDPAGTQIQAPYLLMNNSPADNEIRSLSADYSQPLGKGQLEAGLKATLTTTDNDINWQQQLEKQWVTDKGKTNHFIYDENIYAAYATYSRTIKKFDLQAGLRAEQTYTKGTSLTLNQVNKRDQLNVFPSLVVMYNQSQQHQYGFSYRKSIDRYSFDVVNPFITYVSQYQYNQGNPNIRPSIGHSFELSYTYNNELFTSVNYQRFTDVPAEIFRKDTGNVVISTEVNLNSADAVNASITWSKSLLDNKWTSTNSAMFTYAKYNQPGGNLDNALTGAFVKTNNIFTIAKGLSAELSAYYFSSFVFGVYKYKPRYAVSAGISKSILNNAGKLTFNVSDLFNTLSTDYNISSFGVTSYSENKIESRFFRMVFSYKFGNLKVKAARNRTSGIEDQQFRMGGN